MSRLSTADWQLISTCLERLYACRSLAEFPLLACTELPKLIGADNTTFNYVASSIDKYVAAWAPDLGRFEERVRLTAELLPCHPVANHQLATGDGSARLISDFCTEREFHRLPIYDPLYREMGYEDQLAFLLFPPGGEMIALAFARDRRSFTVRDRQVADWVRPHVAQAYRNAEAFTRLNRKEALPAWASEVLRVTTVRVGRDFRPGYYAAEAQGWLAHFFPDSPGLPRRFPAAVEGWLRLHVDPVPAPAASPVLAREVRGERLSLRTFRAGDEGETLLVLERGTPAGAKGRLQRSGLTGREVEVLRQVELGCTNLEIAARLGISALTVRAHLEHIFEKLGVPNRTAAVMHMRRLCQEAL
jgi:DNA-binding CsgD family transcriptional regulator